jgi:hypothetical protein
MTIEDRIAALAVRCAKISTMFEELRALREKVRVAEAVFLIGQRPNEMWPAKGPSDLFVLH